MDLDELHASVLEQLYIFRDNMCNIGLLYRQQHGCNPPLRCRVGIGRSNLGTQLYFRWRAPRKEWECQCSNSSCTQKHVFLFRKTVYNIASARSLEFFKMKLVHEEMFFRDGINLESLEPPPPAQPPLTPPPSPPSPQ